MLVFSIFIYIAVTLLIGFWASKRVKTTNDFTLAGRSLSAFMVGVTIFATWFGPELIMGVPGLFVENGIMGIITDQFGNFLCLILVGTFYSRKLYRMKITTIADFFKLRYDKNIELLTSIIQVLTYFFWIAAQFVALGLLFQTVLGLSVYQGIFLGASIVVIYTFIGGMWAVSFTDLLQSIIIVIGLVLLLDNILNETGGIIPIISNRPEGFYRFFPQKGFYNWTDYISMWMALGIGAISSQEIYQRVFSAKSESAGTKGVYLSAILLFVIGALPLIIGLGAAQLHPQLMDAEQGQNLIPAMVLQYTSLPVQMLLYGAIISAILSTSSGALLSPATIIGENLIKHYYQDITDAQLLLWTRLSVIFVALLSCFVAIGNTNIHGLVVASTILPMVCLFAPLTFGLYWKKSSVLGTWFSVICGGLAWLICYYLETRIDPTIYGTLLSCAGLIIGSLIIPKPSIAE